MLTIKKEPKNESYKNLIEYALNTSDAFMFVTCDFDQSKRYKDKVIPFIDKNSKYILKIRHNKVWPGVETLDSREYNIYLFKCDKMLKDMLLEPKGLYKWIYPNYPEDLSFFRKGKCWLSSISHEKYSNIYIEDQEEISIIKKLGIKIEEVDVAEDYEDFYEEYNID